ncbi:MAG TPA: Gfo/Idh/MocA family oxidoreductase [Amaricoccus sp.]|nr:Gfo/Idh/MocA family oxidoreductase [Amaricoccus sp.]
MTRLRVGVVGSGIGASHIEAFQALPEMYEVAVLCDTDTARAGQVAERLGVPAVVGALDELLASDLDIIDLCTPSGLHQAQAVAVLAAGKHAVIEKPVAKSLAEVDAIAAAEAASAGRACPIFQYRFGHGLQRLAHLRAKGYAAEASVATAETHWYRGADYYGRAAWRGTFDGELGGCLATHAIHIHDILCEVLGPLASVHARTSRRLNGNETEDMAVLSLGFVSGAFATSSVSLGSRQEMSRLRFVFGDLVAESGLSPYNPGHDPWSFPHDDPEAAGAIMGALADFRPLPERFVGQFHRMHAGLTTGGPLPVTLADARRAVELLTAAYYSAMTGEAVALPLGPGHPFYGGWLDAMKEAAVG